MNAAGEAPSGPPSRRPFARNATAALWERLRAVLPDSATVRSVRRAPARDLLAGVTVAVVALPLALGFGISSGMGTEAGLATAIIAGVLAAVFGGSDFQVSGPTGAMTVVLVPVVHARGVDGVLMAGLMAGVILVGLGLGRVGGLARLVPMPVVVGFTVGIAAVIALQQVPAALGVPTPEGEKVVTVAARALARFADEPRWTSVAVSAAVAVVVLLGARLRPSVPMSLPAVALATVAVELINVDGVVRVGALPSGLQAPSWGFLDPGMVPELLPAAAAIAALAGLESLLSATVADEMRASSDPGRGSNGAGGWRRHDPDRELFGQGVANLAVPLFGGMPATAAIARTAVNVRSGAASRLSAVIHAVVIAAVVAAAAGLVRYIPLAALAGVLVATAIRMVETDAVRALARAGRGELAVMVLTGAVTLVVDLVVAVAVGLALAGALALRQVAGTARVEHLPFDDDSRPQGPGSGPGTGPAPVTVLRIDGPLSFTAAHRLLPTLEHVHDDSVVLIRMSRVSAVDATGAAALSVALTDLEARGVVPLLSGVRPEHHQTLGAYGITAESGDRRRMFPDAPSALAYARALIPAQPHGPS
ncbi:SulP family inorganic anion transporter [Parafrankia soli]|uniref:SulP family inorganic anion transporter n=1 Tax=Parafrankia soli TaxID=2599596 RepID=UPI0009F59FE2|nr:SulP family inorganic anion transporter [Parafrankia soli]